jgi:hypothetical protein
MLALRRVEVFRSTLDPSLKWSIAEWYPTILTISPVFIMLLGISLPMLFLGRSAVPIPLIVVYTALLALALNGSRHVPLWAFFNLYLINKTIQPILLSLKQIPYALNRLKKATWVLFIIVLLASSEFVLQFKQPPSYQEDYPTQAVIFLKTHPPAGHLFASYDWGGYLLWQYPEQKVFIDGRMPSWKNELAPTNESSEAFTDYWNFETDTKKRAELIKKYNITTVLWKNKNPQKKKKNLTPELFRSFFLPEKPSASKDLLNNLADEGWQEIYADNTAVIYQKQ